MDMKWTIATNKVAVQRMEICRVCPELRPLLYQCKKCNCLMLGKTRLNESFCPLNKWGAVKEEEKEA
jgi:hypothetical protein